MIYNGKLIANIRETLVISKDYCRGLYVQKVNVYEGEGIEVGQELELRQRRLPYPLSAECGNPIVFGVKVLKKGRLKDGMQELTIQLLSVEGV